MRSMTMIFGASMLALAAMGCGDDDGTGGTRDSGPAGGLDSGGTRDTGAATVGMCENTADEAALMDMYTVMGEMVDVPTITGDCAVECVSQPAEMQGACVSACISRDTMDAISDPCISCILVGLICARDSGCISPCIGDPSAMACLECQCGDNAMMRNCREEFTACSGVVTTACPGM
jgi:hypothetical protein